MRHLLIVSLILLGAASALAQAADKPTSSMPANVPIGRQGGDTIDDAIPIPNLSFSATGTTTGYNDDYDEACPYTDSTSPDVVYTYQNLNAPCEYADIDLCLSSYDTKVYVYDSQLNVVACNDDFYNNEPCWPYSSKIEMVEFAYGEIYYIVIDGYGGEHGEYDLQITEYCPCIVFCPSGIEDEGEPPLENDVPDTYNSGCDGDVSAPAIMPLPAATGGMLYLCATQGWTTMDGEVWPDTDWMSLVIGSTGEVEVEIQNNLGGILKVITPGDCADLQVQQTIELHPCYDNQLTIAGSPGDEVWLQIDTAHETPFCGEYTPQEWEYWMLFEGLQETVAVKHHSWSGVKSFFHR